MSKQRSHYKITPVLRAIAVLSAVGCITTLVTFAALQSTGNALTGNTIETATAALQISTDGSTYADTLKGFDFSGITPGGDAEPAAPGYLVMLQNTGDTTLDLRLTVTGKPQVTGIPDLSKVNVLVTPYSVSSGGTYPTQSIPLSSLVAGQVSLANATAAAKGNPVAMHLQVSMTSDAVNGPGGTITGLDLSFSGIPQP